MGYYKSPTETNELYQDGWMKTGDQALVRLSPKGHEHLFIVERIKELIKVKVRKLELTCRKAQSVGLTILV